MRRRMTWLALSLSVAIFLGRGSGMIRAEEPPAAKEAPAPAAAAVPAPAAPDPTVAPTAPDPTGGNYTGANMTAGLTKDNDKVTTETLAKDVKLTKMAMNIVWTLITGFLVMFMQAGFALVETGLTRAKNVAHTMAMNFGVYALGMLGFWICGFALMFGGLGSVASMDGPSVLNKMFSVTLGGKTFELLGYKGFFLTGPVNDATLLTLFLFQMVFMDTTATIPTGALAERWKFSAFVVYAFFVSMIIYPVFGCWVWGGGWLSDLGSLFGLGNGHVDFAGSSVVHMTGGVTGLAGALDPRSTDRQVQQGWHVQPHPRSQHPDGGGGDVHPGLRLVRVQPRQHPGRDRPADWLGGHLHHAGLGGRCPQLDALHVGGLW